MLHDQPRLDELGHRAALKFLGAIVAMDRVRHRTGALSFTAWEDSGTAWGHLPETTAVSSPPEKV